MHLPVLIFVLLTLQALTDNQECHESPETFSDSTSCWKGFTRYHFNVDGRKAFITTPKNAQDKKEWVWRARFPEWHTEMDEIPCYYAWSLQFELE